MNEWGELILDQGLIPCPWAKVNNWSVIRKMIVQGIVSPPTTDAYISCMVGAAPWKESIKEWLLANPALLENEVWRTFEVEGLRGTSLAGRDKYVASDHTWSFAFREFANEGRLDRARL